MGATKVNAAWHGANPMPPRPTSWNFASSEAIAVTIVTIFGVTVCYVGDSISFVASASLIASVALTTAARGAAAKQSSEKVVSELKSKLKGASKSMASSMSEKELEKMAHTKRKGKPEHVAKT